jgi:hypothetical protein
MSTQKREILNKQVINYDNITLDNFSNHNWV